MDIKNYLKTTQLIDNNINDIIEEIIFLSHTQTAILRNDHYLVKDKDTQAVFESVLCKNQPKINPNNHQKAFDLKHAGNQISIKSGTISNNILKFSYSRTTEYPTLPEKLAYLSKFENLILGIASEKIKDNDKRFLSHNRYYLYYFQANQIDMNDMDWTETPNQYCGISKDLTTSVEIRKKMSDQPWINIPLSQIKNVPLIETIVLSHNNRKYLVIYDLINQEKYNYDVYEDRKKLKSIKGKKTCSVSIIKAAIT